MLFTSRPNRDTHALYITELDSKFKVFSYVKTFRWLKILKNLADQALIQTW